MTLHADDSCPDLHNLIFVFMKDIDSRLNAVTIFAKYLKLIINFNNSHHHLSVLGCFF